MQIHLEQVKLNSYRRNRKKKKLIVMLILFVVFCFFAMDYSIKTRVYNIKTELIDKDIKIVLLTDLHSAKYGDEQINLINAINEENPDVILLGGDICDDIIPNDNTEYLLKGISSKYPIYYVNGNHEYWSNDIETIEELFKSYGVTILNGTSEIFEINGQKINICGITDPDIIEYTENGYDINKQLETLANVYKNGNYTILLAHRPELIDVYRNYNFDLVLSGHAHGGQWRIPFLINGLYAPNQGLFPKYAGGLYQFEDVEFIVSRGLSKWSTAVPRIFNNPEIVVINLDSEDNLSN